MWGVGEVLSKHGLSHISPLWNNIFANVLGLCIYLPVIFLIGHAAITIPSPWILFLVFLSGTFYMSYFYAIEKGTLALTGTVYATYPLFTIVLSQIFLHETISSVQAIAIFLTVLGSVIIVWPQKQVKIRDYAWFYWGLVGAGLQGTGDFLSKVTVTSVGVYNQAFWLIILFQVVSVANYLFDKKGRTLPKFSLKKFIPSVLGAGMVVSGTLFLFFALQYGKATLVAPITAISPTLVVILAFLFLKERIRRWQLVGVGIVLVGIIILSIH